METKPFYQQSCEEVLAYFQLDKEIGLSQTSRQKNQERYGKNILVSIKKESAFRKYLHQFKDLLILLLIVSALISWWLGDMTTTIVLSVLIFINSVIGFSQEIQAEHTMDSLKKFVHATAKIKRDGQITEIATEDIVPGDLVYVEEGDFIPADLRIIEQINLETNDFALTGESNPKNKHSHSIDGEAEIGDRTNLLYMGTTVAKGNGRGVTIATGMDTQFGLIANLTNTTIDELSPLQLEFNNLAKKLTIGTIVLFILLFIISLLQHISIYESLIFAIGIASAMIPQGLPAQISVALSHSAKLLAKQGALIKKLSACETLGAINVICTDKTGTLTKNEMTVQKMVFNKEIFTIEGLGYNPVGNIIDSECKSIDQQSEYIQIFLKACILASTASIHGPDEKHATRYTLGDPTEGALITLAGKGGFQATKLRHETAMTHEYPFDSVRKRMSCVTKHQRGYRIYVKGATESILPNATHHTLHDMIIPLTQDDIAWYTSMDNEYARSAYRNLMIAYKDVASYPDSETMETAESGLTILGMVSIIDPPREDVKLAIQATSKAHIKTIIITGDYAPTALAIASMVGLHNEQKDLPVITGGELRNMGDQEIKQLISNNLSLLFSRSSPEDKTRIVGLCKSLNMIVAVTGDGVNDAPALKRANIGVAMGKTGTDVAKESAEIILLDDSFGTLVKAIHQGRVIYKNIQKTALSCLCKNGAELAAVLLSFVGNIFYGISPAIQAIQILAIDLMAEILPLTALGYDKPQEQILTEHPRDTSKHLLNKFWIYDLIRSGVLLMGGLSFFAYRVWYYIHGVSFGPLDITNPAMKVFYGQANVMTYLSIVLCQFANILSRRVGENKSIFTPFTLTNKSLRWSFLISILLVIHFIYAPWMHTFFGTAPLPRYGWAICLGLATFYLLMRELYKYLARDYITRNIVN